MPTRRTFSNLASSCRASLSHQGGVIWIAVQQGIVLGRTDVTITNGVRMPYFEHGVHTNADWATMKNNPAPVAEFVSDQLVLTVASSKARTVADPEGMMIQYDAMMDVFPELAVVSWLRPASQLWAFQHIHACLRPRTASAVHVVASLGCNVSCSEISVKFKAPCVAHSVSPCNPHHC